jgi:hypothetical protein
LARLLSRLVEASPLPFAMGAQFKVDRREAFEREDQQRERGRVFANLAAEGARKHACPI